MKCVLLCIYPHMKFYVAYEIFFPTSSLIIWKSLCWSLRYVLLSSDGVSILACTYLYPENALFTSAKAAMTIMLNLFHIFYIFCCRLFYGIFWHMLGLQLCYPLMHRLYMICVWDRNNKMCQSLHGGKGSFLSSQPPQMLSLCLLMLLNDSNIQIFIQVSGSWCSACGCSCMQAKLNVCICDMMRSPSEIVLLC